MVEQVEHLKDKYEGLENRRKVEAWGYQTDVKILKEKLRQVEHKLVRATLAKVKGLIRLSQFLDSTIPIMLPNSTIDENGVLSFCDSPDFQESKIKEHFS